MEELKSGMEEHMELMADLVQTFSSDIRFGFSPAYDNFMGFFHAIDWKVAFQCRFFFTPFVLSWFSSLVFVLSFIIDL
ncbi:hypothetical protein DEO72_LG5g2407 [Vigna unguiculata]|uniref:Uncharacterized protein n=1 Tax=Vigna unguiculata TaxID=3917 RepID=A0A4D6M2P9_VIGUN|nr:hypothetical protein DEO72_LG5g2407 [Vigna unguiculata]